LFIDEPLPGNDANSPSITNQLRNEELERRQAVTNNYDMFADDYSDTNVNILFHELTIKVFIFILESRCMAFKRKYKGK